MKNLMAVFIRYKDLIWLLGLPYASILLISAFGPAIEILVSSDDRQWLSTIFLFFLILGMLIPVPLKREKNSKLYFALVTTNSLGFAALAHVPFGIQAFFLLFNGFSLGRIAVFWSRLFYERVPKAIEGRVIGWSIFMAYLLLYIGNSLFPSLNKTTVSLLLAFVIMISTVFHIRTIKSGQSPIRENKKTFQRKNFPLFIYLVILIIYLTAGFTYTKIYPYLLTFGNHERFYNVLPFVLSAPFIGSLSDRFSSRHLLYLGISFLGIGFVFLQGSGNPLNYYLIQTAIQPGWAFLDIFVWVIGVELARRYENPYFITCSVAVFLLGTAIGSLVSIMTTDQLTFNLQFQLYLTLLPLFIAFLFFNRTMQIFQKREFKPLSSLLEGLTEREKEIAILLIENKTQKDIADLICISVNTLKTHCRNIYRKTGTSNKRELMERFNNDKSTITEEIQWN